MTQFKLNEYRIALQNKRAELVYRNRSRGDLAIEAAADEMDQTQGVQERDLAMGNFDRDAMLLRDVRAALGRMETGTFGICVDCEEGISEKRLAAVPWAASCIVCQHAADSMHGQTWSEARESLINAA